jgi:hypothetical protein
MMDINNALLCGCQPCRQSALNSLRTLIRRKEGSLRRNTAAKDALRAAAMVAEDDQYRIDCESFAVELDYASHSGDTVLRELRALEAWLAERFEDMPQEVERALWRLIEKNPHVPF